MPLPTGYPEKIITSIRTQFQNGNSVWPRASVGEEAHYQKLGVMLNYLIESDEGYKLTDLGRNEAQISSCPAAAI